MIKVLEVSPYFYCMYITYKECLSRKKLIPLINLRVLVSSIVGSSIE